MADQQFDIVVIGAGPAGYVAANRASQLGLKTAVVERDKPGGICLNWGCIPSKALLKAAQTYHIVQEAEEFGITTGKVKFDFAKIMARSRDVANRLGGGVKFLFDKFKVTYFAGTAVFKDRHTLTVTDADGTVSEVTGKHIIVATGARPRQIPGIDFDGKKVLNYFHALDLKTLPKKVVIVGAGAIGMEFGYFWSSFGSDVTIVEMLPQVLPIEDEDCAKEVARYFKRQGVSIKTATAVKKIDTSGRGVKITLESKGKQEVLQADCTLVAIGVQVNSENLNLEKMGVRTERGSINVDTKTYKTTVPNIYAIGDCIATPMLAHVASAEALVCVEKIAGHDVAAVDYDVIPSCTYCQPQVASVGLTEAKAKEAGYTLKIGKFSFKASGKAQATNETSGFVKLIFDAETGTIVGGHIVGSEATELIAEVVLAKNYELTYEEILKTIHAHPTLSEAVMEAAAMAWGQCVNQ